MIREGEVPCARRNEPWALTNRHLLAFSRRRVAIPRVVDLNEIVLGIDKDVAAGSSGKTFSWKSACRGGIPAVKWTPRTSTRVIMNSGGQLA
mgnify:CR=1 FL=1